MKLGPLLLLSLLIHGALLLALLAAPGSRAPAPPPAPPLVWMQLAAPAPAAATAPAAMPSPTPSSATAPAVPAVATAPTAPAAPGPAPAAASRPSQPRAMARSAPLAPMPAVPHPPDEPGIELPIEAEAGDAASRSSASARTFSGSALSVPALPGPAHAGAPPSAPAAPPFDVRAYADSIRRRIDAEKQYPARARRLGLQGVATVLVAVDSRGRLVRPPRLARTSGVAALDHEALRMVQAAAPFTPPAGAALATTPLEVQVPVRFSLTDAP